MDGQWGVWELLNVTSRKYHATIHLAGKFSVEKFRLRKFGHFSLIFLPNCLGRRRSGSFTHFSQPGRRLGEFSRWATLSSIARRGGSSWFLRGSAPDEHRLKLTVADSVDRARYACWFNVATRADRMSLPGGWVVCNRETCLFSRLLTRSVAWPVLV